MVEEHCFFFVSTGWVDPLLCADHPTVTSFLFPFTWRYSSNRHSGSYPNIHVQGFMQKFLVGERGETIVGWRGGEIK